MTLSILIGINENMKHLTKGIHFVADIKQYFELSMARSNKLR